MEYSHMVEFGAADIVGGFPIAFDTIGNSTTEMDDDKKISINAVNSRMEEIVDEMLWDTKVQFFIELI